MIKPYKCYVILQTQWKVYACQEESLKCQFDSQPQTFQWRHAVLHTGSYNNYYTISLFSLSAFLSIGIFRQFIFSTTSVRNNVPDLLFVKLCKSVLFRHQDNRFHLSWKAVFAISTSTVSTEDRKVNQQMCICSSDAKSRYKEVFF